VLKITNINQSLVESENGPRNLVRAIFHSYPSIIFLVETCEQIGRHKQLPLPRHAFFVSHNG
jgi:hypothetical protein